MFSLIKNEFSKLLRQKYIYIILVVIVGFVTLATFLDFKLNKQDSLKYDQKEVERLEATIKDIEKKIKDTKLEEEETLDPEENHAWVENKEELEQLKAFKILKDDWRKRAYKSNISGMISDKIDMEYRELINKKNEQAKNKSGKHDKKRALKNNPEYIKLSAKIEKEFEEIKKAESPEKYIDLKLAQINKALNVGKEIPEELKIGLLEQKKVFDLRKKYNINYTNQEYEDNFDYFYIHYDEMISSKRNETEKQQLKIKKAKIDHMFETGEEVTKTLSAYKYLEKFWQEKTFFILILTISFAANMIGEEYNKGTIKTLLTSPHRRTKIIFSKIITVVIMTILSYIAVMAIVAIITGLFFGFKSLTWKVPIVHGDHVVKYGIIPFSFLTMLTTIPEILMYSMFAFAISTIFQNTAVGITLGFISNIATGIVNQVLMAIYQAKHFEWIKYIPTVNWNWTYMIYGTSLNGIPIQPLSSILITIASFVIIILPAVLIFKNKEIHNV